MTDRSSELIWALTKKNSQYRRKWMGKDWSVYPWSMDGKWNAKNEGNTIGVEVRKDSTDKNFKRTFTMSLKSSHKNGISKNKKNSQSSPAWSSMDIGRSPARAAKAVNAQRPPLRRRLLSASLPLLLAPPTETARAKSELS